jgi:KipI family sensor histidine kinase inhibitor
MNVRFLSSGDTAIVVEFGDRIDRILSDRVLKLSTQVRAANLPGVVETVPTFRSLMVHYDPLITDSVSLIRVIEKLLHRKSGETGQMKLWRVPACYATTHAPDLAEVAERTGLFAEEVVRLHSSTRFHIYMIGFVPGYPYMGDLPEPLTLPRRADPRTRVPAGSIAIATNMTAIYPLESPGGWHLIGTTPIRLFNPYWPRPALFSPGDAVRFEPITVREFESIRAAVAADTYQVPYETTGT